MAQSRCGCWQWLLDTGRCRGRWGYVSPIPSPRVSHALVAVSARAPGSNSGNPALVSAVHVSIRWAPVINSIPDDGDPAWSGASVAASPRRRTVVIGKVGLRAVGFHRHSFCRAMLTAMVTRSSLGCSRRSRGAGSLSSASQTGRPPPKACPDSGFTPGSSTSFPRTRARGGRRASSRSWLRWRRLASRPQVGTRRRW